MTRRSLPTIITMRPLAGAVGIADAVSATTIAGTKPVRCPSGTIGSGRKERRQLINKDRDIPYRRAVYDIARGVCKLSSTILNFSSLDQRRR